MDWEQLYDQEYGFPDNPDEGCMTVQALQFEQPRPASFQDLFKKKFEHPKHRGVNA